jgi:hypothetical protein
LSQWRWNQPTLIVIDYAAVGETPPLRFLLLERGASLQRGWYQSLVAIGDSFTFDRAREFFDPKERQELGALTGADFRRRVFHETLNAAQEKLNLRHASLPAARRAVEAELEKTLADSKWSQPLVLMMAALYASETGIADSLRLNREELALRLAGREQQRIKRFAPPGSARAGDLLAHLAACATVCGGLTREEAVTVAGRECRELGLVPDLIGEATLTPHLQISR